LAKPDLIELHNIRATVQMQDKSTVRMTARQGLYNSKSEMLDLANQINLTSSDGYRARLSEAKVDIGKGHVVSEHPVELDMLQGRLEAKRMEIVDSGNLVRFSNGVRMTMLLNKGNDAAMVRVPADRSIQTGASASALSDGVR
jgi:lipopolysaccharide export system protein LptC